MSVLLKRVQALGTILLDLLYPPRCIGCGQVGETYCSACRQRVQPVEPPICPSCGRSLNKEAACAACAQRSLRMDGIRATALFEGTLREAIHALKYKNMRSLAPFLGQMLVETYEAEALPADVLVPVPLHRRRLRERGYNQSSLLAKYVGQVTGLPVSTTSLRRVRYTISQTQLNAEERVHNVSGAFLCSREDVGDRQVLLIDDVCTTGATLEACSVALYDGGARSVWALTVARAS